MLKNSALFSKHLVKDYIFGRNRYGSVPEYKSALLRFTFVEREVGFESRLKDPLEWVRHRLRERVRGKVEDVVGGEKEKGLAERVYEKSISKKVVKEVFN